MLSDNTCIFHVTSFGESIIGVLKKKEKKEKDNQYKLKKTMAIAIGLINL